MSKSIMSHKHECYVCGRTSPLHLHHVYGGGSRKASDRAGFTVLLCQEHHTGRNGIHFNKELDTAIKQTCQRLYEETHSREEFMTIIGRNYLE